MALNLGISVIISVYRGDSANDFFHSMHSLLIQTEPPQEIIIARDGPVSDEMENVLTSFLENNDCIPIRLVDSNVNVGRGEMLRRAVSSSIGPLIAIMDADDICYQNRFRKQVDFFRKHPHVDVVGSWVCEDWGGNVIRIKIVPEKQKDIKKYARYRNPINQMTVMFKKDSAVKAGNYEALELFEDAWLWQRMLHNGCEFYNIKECLVQAKAGADLVRRRTGTRYFNYELRYLKKLYDRGFITLISFILSVIVRGVVRVSPLWAGRVAYCIIRLRK